MIAHGGADIGHGGRQTLAQGVTAALPPGEARLFQIALNVAAKDRPLQPEEDQALRQLAGTLAPLFRRPAAAP